MGIYYILILFISSNLGIFGQYMQSGCVGAAFETA